MRELRSTKQSEGCNAPTSLYRHFSSDGELLYVGVSKSAPTRLAQHMRGSPWAREISGVEIEHWPSRREALAAEKTAIRAERPLWNIAHSTTVGASPDPIPSVPMNLPLSRAYHEASLVQKRLLSLGLSKLSGNADGGAVTFGLTEYRDTFLNPSCRLNYSQVKAAVDGLSDGFLAFNRRDAGPGGEGFAKWVSESSWCDGDGIWVTLVFTPDVIANVLQGAVEIPLSWFKGVTSLHSYRLMELLLVRGVSKKSVTLTLDEMHHALNASEAAMSDFRDFKRRYVSQASRFFEQASGVRLTMKTRRVGRRVHSLSFSVA